MPQEIIDFWFSEETSKLWFKSTPEFDQLLRERYQETWRRARDGELDHWLDSAEGCLALVIVLDQFPLNMFRGEARCFSTEAQSRDVARHAIAQGFDRILPAEQAGFIYRPFQHSESLADQDYAIELYQREGLERALEYTHHHRSIIERFGRFPHRNAILGRESTEAEIEYLNSKEAFNG